MANWGKLYLSIHTVDDLINVKHETDNGRDVYYLKLMEADGEQVLDMVGSGQFSLPLWDRDAYPLIQKGRIARVYVHSQLISGDLEVATFIIKTIKVKDPQSKEPRLVISGPDLLEETKRRLVRQSVIGEKTTGTIVQIGGAVDLDSGASAVDDFYNGAVIQSGSSSAIIEDYNGSIRRCTLTSDGWSAGMPSASDPYTIYNGKASDDLDQIIAWAPTGWSVSQSGTTDGTTMVLAGETVYDALRKTAQQSGEHFSLTDQYPPTRAITWVPSTGIVGPVTLDQVTETTRSQFAGDITMAPILEIDKTESDTGAMTRAYVTGGSGNNKITLRGLVAGDITIPSGWTVDLDASLIVNAPAESSLHTSQYVEATLNITHIHPETDTSESRKLAKIELFNAAISTMRGADPTEEEYIVVTASQKEIRPGHKLYTTYTKTGPVGEVLWEVDEYLYVHKVKNYVSKATKGARYTRLILKNTVYTPYGVRGGRGAADPSAAVLSSHNDALAHGTGWAGDAYLALGGGSTGTIDSGEYVLRDGTRSITGNLEVDSGITIDGVDLSADVVLRDGSNSVTGNLPVDGGITIDGVDLSAHAADQDAHHDHATAGSHISLSGQVISVLVTSDADTNPSTVLAGDVNGRLRVDGLGINTPATGSGLAIDGDIGFVGAQQITTDGGGNLTLAPAGDLTVAPAADVDLSPVSGHVKIDAALDFQGAQSITTAAGILTLAPADDLALSPTGGNVTIAADLDFQGAKSITTSTGDLTISPAAGDNTIFPRNSVFGDATTTDNAAIKTKAIEANDYALYVQQRSDQATSMVRFEDSGGTALVVLTKDGDLESGNPGFTSGLTGWQIDHLGDAEFNNLVARGEFHASVFVADEMHSTGGTMAVMSTGVLHSDATLPAATGSTFAVNVKASVGAGLCPFAVDDVLRMKFLAYDGSNLGLWDVGAEVDSIAAIAGRDLTISEQGYFAMTCTWRTGGQAALTVPALTAIIKWGEVGGAASSYVGGLILSSDLSNSPYIDVFTLPADHTWGSMPTATPRVRMGNLDGVLGLSEEWGIALGTNLADTTLDAQYIVASDQRLKLNNIDLGIYDSSGNQRIALESGGDVRFGTNVNAGATTSFYHTGSSGFVRLGPYAANKGNMVWNGTDFHIRMYDTAVISLKSDGNSYFSGVMKIDTGGAIRQGAGTWGTDFDGFSIYNDSGVGTFTCYNDGDEVMRLNENGISVYTDTADPFLDARALSFTDATTVYGGLYAKHGVGANYVFLEAMATTGKVAQLNLSATGAAGKSGMLYIDAHDDAGNNTHVNLVLDTQLSFGQFKVSNATLEVEHGVHIGSTSIASAPNTGQLILDQGVGDYSILRLVSSDVDHGMTGVIPTDVYSYVLKQAGTVGGVKYIGLTESTIAMVIAGMATTVDTTESATSDGTIKLVGYKKSGTSVDVLASDDNLVVIENVGTAAAIFKAGGDLHLNGVVGSAFDAEDDMALISSVAEILGGENFIQTQYDNLAVGNRSKLDELGIINKEGYVSVQGMDALFIGAFRQEHVARREMAASFEKRIAQLEAQIGNVH